MKTNHRRGFKAAKHPNKGGQSWGNQSLLADMRIGAGIGYDFSQGHRGMARAVRGAKKFVRTRIRFHENAATRQMARNLPEEID